MNPLIAAIYRLSRIINMMLSPSRKQVEGALRRIIIALNETPMRKRYWLCGGALLGYAREGRLLKYDTDIDFHYWEEDEELLREVIRQLSEKGFVYVGCHKDNSGRPTQHILKYKRVKVEFFLAWRFENSIRWICYSTRHWNRPARQYLNEIPSLEFSETEFYGLPVPKPIDHDRYLSSLYGDWKHPMPDYTYFIDSKAIISREPWSNHP